MGNIFFAIYCLLYIFLIAYAYRLKAAEYYADEQIPVYDYVDPDYPFEAYL
jgi:hypothetical protein